MLSICIPTFNHAEALKESLDAIIPQAREFGIPVYVSDNASTDKTLEVLASYQKAYPLLSFRSNGSNLGFDQNVINAAHMASSKYVWTLGARRVVSAGMVKKIHNALEQSDLDLIVLNDVPNFSAVPFDKTYTSATQVIRELHRQLTCIGLQVVRAEAWKSESVVKKYFGTGWVHFGVSLEFIAAQSKPNILFISETGLKSAGSGGWLSTFLQVWKDWKKAVYSLPRVYSDEDKEYVIQKSASYLFFTKFRLTEIRAKRTLLDFRAMKIYNASVFAECREELVRYGGFTPSFAYAIARFPVSLIKLYFKVYDLGRSLVRKFVHLKGPLNPGARL